MTGTMTPGEWVDAIDKHYLDDYLPGGGSTVKFIACSPEVRPHAVAECLRLKAEQRGLLVASVDASVTRVHMIEHLVGRIFDQIPWRFLVDKVLTKFARSNHWKVPDSFSEDGVVEQLDHLNGLGTEQISLELQRNISTEILLNRRLSREFRLAMHWLSRSRLKSGADGDHLRQTLMEWLGGRTRLISELRRFEIFTKINRSNARNNFGSLLHFAREAGYPGLVVNLDCYRLLTIDQRSGGALNYSNAAVLDAYQVFREFIDTTDELEGFMLNVFVPMEFINRDPRSRGLVKYSALFDRVYDGVRDRVLPNPLSALVRLGELAEVTA